MKSCARGGASETRTDRGARRWGAFAAAAFAVSVAMYGGCSEREAPTAAPDASTGAATIAGVALAPTRDGIDVVAGARVSVRGGPNAVADAQGKFVLRGVT